MVTGFSRYLGINDLYFRQKVNDSHNEGEFILFLQPTDTFIGNKCWVCWP